MSKNLANFRRVSIAVLAASLIACGTVQGATQGRGGAEIQRQFGDDVHLTEFDPNDTSSSSLQDGGSAAGETSSGATLVP
jgi:hypothetical protein